MPPLAPLVDHKAGSRQQQRHADKALAGAPRTALAQRSASFHGRGAAEQQQQQQRDDVLIRPRPRTHPDLLAGVSEHRSFRRRPATHGGDAAAHALRPGRAAPSKVLVTVAVQRSMWPLQVMALAEWRVADLVAALELYVREGRRPLLPCADPSAFGLHYSQFSLQSLDPDEKLMEVGSRSFFLCPRAAAAAAASSPACPPTEASKATATSGERINMLPAWLGFMHFWPLLQRSPLDRQTAPANCNLHS
ncbi:unnamed protein product [Urochloa decumbens]|uniref:DUF7054 domain-containing protein n=1 Tax=Urochloa decumbens TaxID=240449 RepID=A0ABC8VBS0_9POAL